MPTKDPTPELSFLLRSTVDRDRAFGDDPLLSLRAEVVTVLPDSGEVRYFGSWDNPEFDGLCVTAYAAKGFAAGVLDHTYGWNVEYLNVHSVRLDRAEAMTKMLRKVDKALRRQTDAGDWPLHFAEYLLRVARAIGVTKVGWNRSERPNIRDYVWHGAATTVVFEHIVSQVERVVPRVEVEA
jgi:hypothetical protein